MIFKKLDEMQSRYQNLQAGLEDPSKAFSSQSDVLKEMAALEKILRLYDKYKEVNRSVLSCQKMVKEEAKDLAGLAREELLSLENQKNLLISRIKQMMIPKEPLDKKDVVLEIRPAAGGNEAALFCRDLFAMYSHYAEKKKWRVDILSLSANAVGGFKELICAVEGKGVYADLKYESGVHRVQRVPVTESQGRVHTSTVTVVVLPCADPVDVQIKSGDVRVDFFRSSGSGGQHVNTTDSAVRVVHLPTQITVQCQDEKSQHANKQKAMRVLYARLFDRHIEQQRKAESKQRLLQIGTGSRSEKVRTYNFPDSRVTDHRLSVTLYSIDQIMKGDLHLLIQPLKLRAVEEFFSGEGL